ncbi:metalloprotease TIKI1 [Caerostris darwini]|uniref:Metalloprotease TIKI homolog n=1 Tax=Caerostris darwini TaxID=1538125 RepID=A0AAV4Q1B4_9ARAC|nr:metalloprotease TIKI1 [Caerostris darwini]
MQGSPFLWTLPGREPPVYFFGTIHVPYTLVWGHVPWLAKQSFERADSVFFELDLTDPETVAQLSSCQMLPSGKTLADILPEDLYRRLKGHLDYVKLMIPSWMQGEQRGLYSEYLFKAITGNWEKKRPVWVMLMINSLTESDIRSTGIPVLDLWLAREATRLGKRSGAVERVEEQCLPLNGLNGTQGAKWVAPECAGNKDDFSGFTLPRHPSFSVFFWVIYTHLHSSVGFRHLRFKGCG